MIKSQIVADCTSLHQQIMDIGGNKLKAVQTSLDMIKSRIDQTTGLINKANVAVKTAKRYFVFGFFTVKFLPHVAHV